MTFALATSDLGSRDEKRGLKRRSRIYFKAVVRMHQVAWEGILCFFIHAYSVWLSDNGRLWLLQFISLCCMCISISSCRIYALVQYQKNRPENAQYAFGLSVPCTFARPMAGRDPLFSGNFVVNCRLNLLAATRPDTVSRRPLTLEGLRLTKRIPMYYV